MNCIFNEILLFKHIISFQTSRNSWLLGCFMADSQSRRQMLTFFVLSGLGGNWQLSATFTFTSPLYRASEKPIHLGHFNTHQMDYISHLWKQWQVLTKPQLAKNSWLQLLFRYLGFWKSQKLWLSHTEKKKRKEKEKRVSETFLKQRLALDTSVGKLDGAALLLVQSFMHITDFTTSSSLRALDYLYVGGVGLHLSPKPPQYI